MAEHRPNNAQQLQSEVNELRKENQHLQAQLSFHQRIFKNLQDALGAASQVEENQNDNVAIEKLLSENERLKSELKLQRLSNREKEILKLIINGFTSKEIALELEISKLTVDTHRKNIQHKLDVPNTVGLIRIGLLCDIL
ncbi:MAG: LuxR C-terminal-related transcriptional regulator [Saprospiraceae bacterium]